MNGTTTNFVYDGLNPVQEKSGATVTANLLTGLGIDEFFTRTEGGTARSLLPDALGSTVALGDGTGTLQTQYTYEPFGFTTQTGTVSTNSYKYTGREDDGTGLMYYRARYYQPRFQRFIAEDPIGLVGGPNTYLYSRANPLTFIDPTGLLCVYSQSTGSLSCTDDSTGEQYLRCNGYAGNGPGLNNPDAQNQPNVGPLPQGDYTVGGSRNGGRTGPMSRPLTPNPNNNMFGRHSFSVHGDNQARNQSASNGCPILPRDCREGIPTGETFRVEP